MSKLTFKQKWALEKELRIAHKRWTDDINRSKEGLIGNGIATKQFLVVQREYDVAFKDYKIGFFRRLGFKFFNWLWS